MAFPKKIVVVVHHYFTNGASLPDVLPGTVGRMHGISGRDLGLGMVSHDLGLNRRKRWYSFSNLAIDDAVILQEPSFLNAFCHLPRTTSFHHVDLCKATHVDLFF
jgi:hypothetical protein